MINQEFIKRLTPSTIAAARTLNYRVGEVAAIAETGVAYICRAAIGDITLDNGLYLHPTHANSTIGLKDLSDVSDSLTESQDRVLVHNGTEWVSILPSQLFRSNGALAVSLDAAGNMETTAGLALGGTKVAGAMLSINSTTEGLLLPRMTTAQRDVFAATAPVGAMIYNTTLSIVETWDGASLGWNALLTNLAGKVVPTLSNGQALDFNSIVTQGYRLIVAPTNASTNFPDANDIANGYLEVFTQEDANYVAQRFWYGADTLKNKTAAMWIRSSANGGTNWTDWKQPPVKASDVDYDDSTSGMGVATVQAAIANLDNRVDGLASVYQGTVGIVGTDDLTDFPDPTSFGANENGFYWVATDASFTSAEPAAVFGNPWINGETCRWRWDSVAGTGSYIKAPRTSSVDLGSTPTANDVSITNTAGTNADILGATETAAGALNASDKKKLNDHASARDDGATANGIYKADAAGTGFETSSAVTVGNASSELQVDSTTKGFVPPRVTRAQRLATGANGFELAVGATVYQTDDIKGIYVCDGTSWFYQGEEIVPDAAQVVYVSSNGNDSNDGRTLISPVATIAKAMTVIATMPNGSRRVIICPDASAFTEDITVATPVDLELPYATITGHVTSGIAARGEMCLGAVVGDVTVTNGAHYNIKQLSGNLTIGDGSSAAPYIRIQDYVAGTFDDSAAQGDVYFEIIHDLVGVTPTPTVGYVPYGRIGEVDLEPASAVRDKLQSFTDPADYLDAAFIKNLPASGDTHPYAQFTDLGAAGIGWYDLITWPALTAGTIDTSGSDFILYLQSGVDTIITCRLNTNLVRGVADDVADNTMRILGLVQTGDIGGGTQYRMIRDSAALTDSVRLQIYVNPSKTYSGLMSSILPLPYPAGAVFGSPALYTSTGNEVVLSSMDTTGWAERDVIDGAGGGIACESVGEHSQASRAYIDFSTGSVDLHADDIAIMRASATGTRMSAGEYGDWFPTNIDWPIDAQFWNNVIAQKRTNVDDTSLNPSSTITWSAVNVGGTNAVAMAGFDTNHRGLRFTTTSGTRGITMTFANCLYQRLTAVFRFAVGTTLGGTQDYELVDANGTQVASWDIPATTPVGGTVSFSHTFDTGAGDEVLTLRKRSTGTGATVYLYDYDLAVAVNEPALEPLVVVQQDSPLRGTLLPRIIPQNTGHPLGSMALNGLAGNRPIWYDGEDWAYLNTTRIGFSPVDSGQFFFADGGTFNDSGWTGSNHVRLLPVQDFQGFPELIRCTQSGGTITIQAPNNTQAFWDIARANGFRTDFRMMFGALYDGSVWYDIEPNNTSWGSSGRFEFNVTSNAGQLQITMINSGGNTTFDIERDVMHTISMICPPNSDVAEVHVEGVKVGEITYGGGGSNERGTFFYIPPGNPVNDFCFQSITTYAMAAAERDVTLDRTSIETGLRYNIPNINAPTITRVPKGLYDYGNTFTIVNGSTEVGTVQGLDDDHQLFGGVGQYEIGPQKEVTFTQTGFPRGNVWAVEGGKTIINHNENTSTGNSLHLTLDSTVVGNVRGRHGTYLGDVTVTWDAANFRYVVAVGRVFPDSTTVTGAATATSGLAETFTWTIAIGEVFVDMYNAAGAGHVGGAGISIYW